ncbi:hypothetical protein F5X68DRAFT_250704 [Plectosphaerella plurivora]|uniref:Monooxygenase n=1 Tax=Plectosphaerella plurivora TaxID=936078 RepID=A0A9P8VI43_9PEZI|nr:hypothetical protein F5X68DRAFT_250704 [Plectosphaerella plurivora]
MDSDYITHPKDGYRRLRCTIIGAGVSGILMAYKLQTYLKDSVDFQVLEKSPDLGGTWYENKYPGCACDVPSHCYQYSFAPNPNWSKLFVSSSEIQSYLKSVARHFDLERFIRYNSKVTSATWSAEAGTWTVEVQGSSPIVSEILVNACGILNDYKMPDIPGLATFAGSVLHTAAWDPSVQLGGKRIAIIGSGASAVQVLPQVQPVARNVQVYIRTPAWICQPMGVPEGVAPSHRYSEDEKRVLRDDREVYLQKRKEIESTFNSMYSVFFKASPEQRDARSRFEGRMREVIRDPGLQETLIPKFEVGCRRVSPGEPFLRSLQEPNVEPVVQAVDEVTPDGVVSGGVLRKADVIIAATGFNTSFRPRFPIIGTDGVDLRDEWKDTAASYMGTGAAGFPNYLIFLGPNTPISNGSALGPIEATSDYFVRLLRKMVRQQAKSFSVRPECQADFDTHTETLMKNMVWTGSCRSWFKQGPSGKVTALWPGSSLHYLQVLAEDRWEDYQWEYERERYAYWGSGFSWVENAEGDPLGVAASESWKMSTVPRPGADLAFYLVESEPLPESRTAVTESPAAVVDESMSTISVKVN